MSNSVQPHRLQPTRLPCPWDSPGKNTGVGCHFLLQCMKVKSESEVTQLCPTLRDPMDCSLPGSSTHGIFQARVLEWGAIAFSATIVWPQINNREGTQLHPSTEKWIKDLLSMTPPIEQDPVSPSVSLSHQEASISLILIHHRADRMKNTITEK